MSRFKLSIPSEAHPALSALLALPMEQVDRLAGAIEQMGPTFSRRDLAGKIEGLGFLDREKSALIAKLLVDLYSVRLRENVGASEFATELLRAIAADDRKDCRIAAEHVQGWIERIEKLLSFDDSLGLAARAAEVLSEQERSLCSVRVLTDIRPVFRVDSTRPPVAAWIVHTLRMRYHENDGQLSDFFVNLDGADLRELKETAERALRKEEQLAKVLNEAGIERLPQAEKKDDVQ